MGLTKILSWGSACANHIAPMMQPVPPINSVYGAPMRSATEPASRLPNGAGAHERHCIKAHYAAAFVFLNDGLNQRVTDGHLHHKAESGNEH